MENKWIEIFLLYACSLKCSFCFQKDLRYEFKKNLEFEEVEDMIKKGFLDGKRFIVFSGWESTLDRNLKKYIALCKETGYEDIRIHTNGLSFSNMDLLKEYVHLWTTGVVISIHGYWAIHDKLVKLDGAFEKVKKTLVNLYEIKKENTNFTIDTNSVLTRYNKGNLKSLFKFLSYFPITRAQIVQLYSLYLFTKEEKQKLYVPYDDFRDELDDIVDTPNINVTLENFPFCKVNERSRKHIEERQRYNNDAFWYLWEWLEESSCTYLKNCLNCKLKEKCTWVPKYYNEVFPNEEFIL